MPRRLRLVNLALLVLSGVTIAAFVLWPRTDHTATGCGPAPVSAEAKRALAAYGGWIGHTVAQMRGGLREETWSDPVTGRSHQVSVDARGRITNESSTSWSGNTAETVWVINAARRWMSTRQRLPAAFRHQPRNGAAASAQVYRDKVWRGAAKVLGRERIDSRDTLHLRETIKPPPMTLPKGLPAEIRVPRQPAFRLDTWVDPLTSLPLRTRFAGAITDEEWLPRSPANVAKTRLVIPPGFVHETGQSSSGGTVLASTDETVTVDCGQS